MTKKFNFDVYRNILEVHKTPYNCTVEDDDSYFKDDFASKDASVKEAIERNYMGLSFERSKSGARKHICCNLNGYYDCLAKFDELNYTFHEIIFDDRPTKFILDIECDITEKNKDLAEGFFNKVVENIIKRFMQFLTYLSEGIKNMTLVPKRDWFLVMQASRENKFSVHVIMHTGYCFHDATSCRIVIHLFNLWCVQKEVLELKRTTDLHGGNFLKFKNEKLFGRLQENIGGSGGGLEDDDDDDVDVSGNHDSDNWYPIDSCFLRSPVYVEITQTKANANPFDTSGNIKWVKILYSFFTPIDLGPLKNTNGSLRCYHSTKASNFENESYRLKLFGVDGNVVNKNSPEFKPNVMKCLVQCGLPELCLKFKDMERQSPSEILLEEKLKNTLAYYAILVYKLYNIPRPFTEYEKENGIKKGKYLSYEYMLKKYGTPKGAYSYLKAEFGIEDDVLSKSNFMFGRKSVEELKKYKCNILLEEREYGELYEIVHKILCKYTNSVNMVGTFNPNLMDIPELKRVKTSQKKTHLLLLAKNVRCEIIYKLKQRKHNDSEEKSTTGGVYYKVDLRTCKIYQKCHREKCRESVGFGYAVLEEFVTKILNIIK